jgi:hypothetical protein
MGFGSCSIAQAEAWGDVSSEPKVRSKGGKDRSYGLRSNENVRYFSIIFPISDE